MPFWGLLANPGFEDQRLKAVYFFAGQAKIGSDPFWADPKYDVPTARNDQTYTVFPEDLRDLWWSDDVANRIAAVDEIQAVGTNVVVMSTWGTTGSLRWAASAPMQTAPRSHEELFDAVVGRPLLIMPAIESANGTVDGGSPAYVFSNDFPGDPANPAPGLVEQVVELIERFVLQPRNPKWPAHFAQMYDNSGTPRYAFNILHVASRQLPDDADAEFAAGFDRVAAAVLQRTGVLVGFTLDLLPRAHPFIIGDSNGWIPWFAPRTNIWVEPGTPVSLSWAGRKHLDLYTIDGQGIVNSLWWDDDQPGGYRSEGWFAIHPETIFMSGSLVTAIRRTDDHVDLFATDRDGVVRTTWWDKEGGYRADGWIAIHPEMQCEPGTPVAASWANEDHLDLFAIDRFGILQSTFWDDNAGGYRAEGWFAIDPSVVFAKKGHVTARHVDEDHLDLYAVDQFGAVRSIWWDSDEGYRAEGWFTLGPQRSVPGARVTALWADSKHLDLFVTGDDGVVRSTYWDAREPSGYRAGGWFDIHPEIAISIPGAPVEALWSHDDTKLHLYMADVSGRVREAVWEHNDDPGKAWSWWSSIWPEHLTAPGGTVTATHPRGVHIDAFVCGQSNLPMTAWQDTLTDTYVPQAENLGPYLRQQPAVLAVQGFIPEIWLGGSNLQRVKKKAVYWWHWVFEDIPVIMDVSPGYDAHLVFPGSSFYGYTDAWRGWLVALWSPAFSGLVYNAWNGYTEGYAGMRQQVSGDRDNAWVRRLFGQFT